MATFSQLRLEQVTGSIKDLTYSGSNSSAAQAETLVDADLGAVLGQFAGAIGRITGKTGTGVTSFTNQAAGIFSTNPSPDSDGGRNLGSSGAEWGELHVNQIDSAAALDINVTTGLTVDATTISVDGTDDSNITVTGAAKDLILAVAGGNAQKLQLDSAGTGTDAIDISASAGGVDVDAAGKLALDGAGGIDIGVAADVAIDIDASTFDLDASGAVTVDGAGIALAGGANASSFNVATGGGDAKDLTISVTGGGDSSLLLSSAGTGADAVSIDASAGSVVIAPSLADEQTLKLGKVGAAQMVFTPSATPANEKISLINTAGTADDAILIDSVAGGLKLSAGDDSLHIDADGTDADALNIDSAGGIDIDAAGAIDILGGSTLSIDAVDDSNLTVTGNGKDLTIAVAGGGTQQLILTSAGTAGDSIEIESSAGGIEIESATTLDVDAAGLVSIDSTAGSMTVGAVLADAQTLKLGKNGAVEMIFTPHGTPADEKISLINTSGTADEAILIDSVAGGLKLAAGDDSLHLDAAGTDADALNVDSAGGIDIDAAAAIDILAGTTVSVKGATSATFGDDTGVLVFDGSGNVSDTGIVNFSVIAGGTMTATGAGLSMFGDDTATLEFDGSGAVSTVGMTTLDLDGSGALQINSSGGAISIGNDNVAQNISVGTAGARTLIALGSSAATETQIEGALVDVNWGNSGGLFAGAGPGVLDSTSSAVILSGALGVALSGSGGVSFSSDGGMTSGPTTEMKFATWGEFSTFRSKSLFDASTTVVGALNALAGAASGGVKGLAVLSGTTVATAAFTLNDAQLTDRVGYDTDGISLVEASVSNTEVYVNGQLLVSGSSTLNGDYFVSSAANPGVLKFAFDLLPNDVVLVKTTADQ